MLINDGSAIKRVFAVIGRSNVPEPNPDTLVIQVK